MAGYVGHAITDALVELTKLAVSDDTAVATNHGLEAAGPPVPLVGELWADGGIDDRLKKRNAADDGWDDVAPVDSDVERSMVSFGLWTPGIPVSVGFAPTVVIATLAILHSDEGETDTVTLMFSRTGAVGQIVDKTLQANDEDLGNTIAAISGDPYLNRPRVRCVFRPSGFLISITNRDDAPATFNYIAKARR